MTATQAAGTATTLSRIFERVAGSTRLSLLALFCFAALAFAPAFTTLPATDRDESRFAQATKQMLETGDFVAIRFQEEARLKKPVGIYWLQAVAVAAGETLGVEQARTTVWLYRIPSLLAALGAVLLTWWTALPLIGRRGALLAGLMLAGTFLLNVEARLAKTDATLLLTVLAMAGVLARLWLRGDPPPGGRRQPFAGLPLLFWSAAAASILVKGPIGPMVVLFIVLALAATTRRWRWLAGLRWLPGVALMLVLVSPWFVAIMIETKGAFLEQSLGKDMLSKVGSGKEGHGAPPGTYLAGALFFFWPFLPFAIVAAPWVWRRRREAEITFLLAWLVPLWLVFEAVPTKLPHYVLPAYPALAMLLAAAATQGGLPVRRWSLAVALLAPTLALAIPVAGIGAGWWYEHVVIWWLLPFGVAAVVLAVLAWRAFAAARPTETVLLAAGAALTLFWGIGWAALPQIRSIWPAPRLMEAAAGVSCRDPHFATLGYREPSLVFRAGTDLAMLPDAPAAVAYLKAAGHPCRVAFVEKAYEPAFEAAVAAAAVPVRLAGRAKAVNVNGNRPLDIGVYEALPAPGS